MKTKIVIIILLFVTMSGFAQQDAQYTHYMYNTTNINPAYAGSRGVISVFGLHRTQWVGLDGAPVTNAVSVNAPIENSALGVGLSFVNDRIGASDENTISADVSYIIQTSENYKLSFGLKATANLLNVDYTKLDRYDMADPQFQNNIDNKFSPNIGAGVYYHSDKLYLGLSVPNFLETEHFNDNSSSAVKERMHYYLIGGYVFDLNPTLKFKPAFLAKAVEGSPLQLDVSGNFLFNEKFTLGLAWRWSSAISAMAGFQVTDGLFIGYGYDLETTKLAHYNSGSHEIFLRFELFKIQNKTVSPRFF
ncbi:type IX secretion system membrane protein PorP/SprF [Flavobacterium sp. GT3P67]|uniref:PorP/SprF family type IX secretion system membrane protein n=1 Tax=Flavobacterium sp. GT3P67 TaxID=2541722 RepID=UPI001045F738|nr:type IX secretion system membrane protein PorP/SprF [Flavobacterium sp. GT3P67]TDE54938.1 type IX secretion system membrane protein PorP/SprF [Flavobacterium sp. GT3P67]